MKCGNQRCPYDATEGRRRCARCARQGRESKLRQIARKLAAGICLSCPLPAVVGKRRCETCLEIASNAAMLSHGRKRRRSYRAHQNDGVDEFDVAYVPLLTEQDRKIAEAGRCRCGLLLPCTSCLPASAVDWRAYVGGPSE
jgi:hypothetical protein